MQIQIIPFLILIAVVGSLTYMIVSIVTLQKKRRKVFARCIAQHPAWEWMGGMRSSVNRLEERIVSGTLKPDQMSEKRKKRADRDLSIYNLVKTISFFHFDYTPLSILYRILNVVVVPDDEFKQYIIEFLKQYYTSGNRPPKFTYTYAFLISPVIPLPAFSLYPRDEAPDNFDDALSFNLYPDFSKKYVLVPGDNGQGAHSGESEADQTQQGAKEGEIERVRKIFTKDIIDFFMHNERYVLHCRENTLRVELSDNEWCLMPSLQRFLKKKFICDYLDTTDTLFSLFRNNFRRLGEVV